LLFGMLWNTGKPALNANSIFNAFRRKANYVDILRLARSRSARHNQLTN